MLYIVRVEIEVDAADPQAAMQNAEAALAANCPGYGGTVESIEAEDEEGEIFS